MCEYWFFPAGSGGANASLDSQRLEDIIVDKESIISDQGATIGALTRKVSLILPAAIAITPLTVYRSMSCYQRQTQP